MQNTKHYNLKKPDATDYYSVNDFNSNADIIDDELNKLNESNKKTQETINHFIKGETDEKIKASNVSIQDTGNNFDSSDVEGALQEVMEEVKKALQNGVDIKDAVRNAINSKLTVPDLPNSATWNDIINSIIQIKEGRGNAQTGDVLEGKKFTNDSGQELTGTIPNRGNGGTITPSTQNQTKPKGYYSSDIVVVGDTDLNPNNIKKGVNIFGVTGNVIQATGNAQTSQVLSGVQFSNANGSGTGTMPNRGGARTITPSTSNQVLDSGYYSGNIIVSGDSGLKATNIKKGVTIFGVAGTLEPTSKYSRVIEHTFNYNSKRNYMVIGRDNIDVTVRVYIKNTKTGASKTETLHKYPNYTASETIIEFEGLEIQLQNANMIGDIRDYIETGTALTVYYTNYTNDNYSIIVDLI